MAEIKEIKNNIKEVPFAYYVDLFKKIDPEKAAARCGTAFDGATFHVRFFFDDYRVTWPEFTISCENSRAFALNDLKAQTFIIRILLEAEYREPTGGFKTFREMSWGEMYISPFTGRCITRAAFSFGTDVPKFALASERMGAKKVNHGDAAYEFEVLPGYFVTLIVWEGDDEFPPNSQILYSDNFEESFAAEDRVVIAETLITLIKNKMKET